MRSHLKPISPPPSGPTTPPPLRALGAIALPGNRGQEAGDWVKGRGMGVIAGLGVEGPPCPPLPPLGGVEQGRSLEGGGAERQTIHCNNQSDTCMQDRLNQLEYVQDCTNQNS